MYCDDKRRALSKLADKIGSEGVNRAVRDSHAKRRPRACGLTIHTGVRCPLKCLYCYIYDMGFSHKFSEYPLVTDELLYAIISNPYFIPGRHGTLMAIGSVTEPFLPASKQYSLELMMKIRKTLGNPTQVSTKLILDQDDIELIYDIYPEMSILVTVVAYESSILIEPNAPHISKRVRFLSDLVDKGFYASLFLRPIIPGVTDRELSNIVKELEDKPINVVVGSLRVTRSIVDRLSNAIDISAINDRLSRPPDERQRVIRMGHVKKKVMNYLEALGLVVHQSACAVNIHSHGLGCRLCRWGPFGKAESMPYPEVYEIKDLAYYMNLNRFIDIHHRDGYLNISMISAKKIGKMPIFTNILKTVYKVPVHVKN